MRFSYIDLRERNDVGQEFIDFISSNHDEILVPIGHGNKEGDQVCGVKADKIEINDSLLVLWLYACNSAKKICYEISQREITTLGFITEVIAPVDDIPEEIKIVKSTFENFEEIIPEEMYRLIRSTLLDVSKEYFKDIKILQAAIINHTRLSLRYFPRENIM